MRVATNEKLVRNRERIAKWGGLGGLGILTVGLILTFQPQYIMASYIALLIGLVVSSVGAFIADTWLKPPRSDEALETALKGLDNRHHLYNWVLPVDHVLLAPTGLTVFNMKKQEGRIEYNGQRWRQHQSLLQSLGSFSRPRLGDPIKDLEQDISRLRDLVGSVVPGVEVPIDGQVVFTSPKAELSLGDSTIPVVHVKKLKAQYKGQARSGKLSEETRRQLEQALDEIAAPKLGG